MNNTSQDSTRFITCMGVVAFCITVALAALYCVEVGSVALWPETLLYAERARNVLDDGRFALSAITDLSFAPLYSMLMLLAFFVPDMIIGHQMLIGAQTLLICSMFYPIQKMLLRRTTLTVLQASCLAGLSVCLPVVLPYASLLVPEALFITLLIWFTYIYDLLLDEGVEDLRYYVWGGILLGLILLTKDMGWVVYGVVVVNTLLRPFKKQHMIVLATPILLAAIWHGYSVFLLDTMVQWPDWNLNNGLARFNFIKNGLIYLSYAGMPLAGLISILACLNRTLWKDGFFRFVFLMVIGTLAYTALVIPITVDGKLDYITNRFLDAVCLLPLIAFFRIADDQRRIMIANSLLILLCLLVFGFPYALKADLITGLGYWAQSLANPNFGIIRNVLMILLLAALGMSVWIKPRWFVWAYILCAGLIALAGFTHNKQIWSKNHEGNFKFVDVAAIAGIADVKTAQGIYADYQCMGSKKNDLGYLYRCYDLSRTLYFMPKIYKPKTTLEMQSFVVQENTHVLFASSEADNMFGKTALRMGLGEMHVIAPSTINMMQAMPVVSLERFDRVGDYMSIPIKGQPDRVIALAPHATFVMTSSKAGCVVMDIKLMTRNEGKGSAITFLLNETPIKNDVFKSVTSGADPEYYALPLKLQEGQNTLQLESKNAQPSNLIMVGRPRFKPCSVMMR